MLGAELQTFLAHLEGVARAQGAGEEVVGAGMGDENLVCDGLAVAADGLAVAAAGADDGLAAGGVAAWNVSGVAGFSLDDVVVGQGDGGVEVGGGAQGVGGSEEEGGKGIEVVLPVLDSEALGGLEYTPNDDTAQRFGAVFSPLETPVSDAGVAAGGGGGGALSAEEMALVGAFLGYGCAREDDADTCARGFLMMMHARESC